jgi:hypothetical protein
VYSDLEYRKITIAGSNAAHEHVPVSGIVGSLVLGLITSFVGLSLVLDFFGARSLVVNHFYRQQVRRKFLPPQSRRSLATLAVILGLGAVAGGLFLLGNFVWLLL